VESIDSGSPKACLLVLDYLEPQQLMEVQGNQAFGQQEFWVLLCMYGFKKSSAVVLQAWGWGRGGEWTTSLQVVVAWGLISCTGFREFRSVALLPSHEN
jgi:hypothetical protein